MAKITPNFARNNTMNNKRYSIEAQKMQNLLHSLRIPGSNLRLNGDLANEATDITTEQGTQWIKARDFNGCLYIKREGGFFPKTKHTVDPMVDIQNLKARMHKINYTRPNRPGLLVIDRNGTYKLNRLTEFIALGWHAPYTISCVGVSAL